jgi:hypothetical protein
MQMTRLFVLTLVLGWMVFLTVNPSSWPARAQTRIDFNRDIRPILSDKCWACHGPDATAKKLKRFDSEATASSVIVPGNPAQSRLLKRIQHADEDLRMPPKATGRTVTPREIELLTE